MLCYNPLFRYFTVGNVPKTSLEHQSVLIFLKSLEQKVITANRLSLNFIAHDFSA